jgi:hypothetical protein
MADDFKSLRGNVEHRAVCLTCRSFLGAGGLGVKLSPLSACVCPGCQQMVPDGNWCV